MNLETEREMEKKGGREEEDRKRVHIDINNLF